MVIVFNQLFLAVWCQHILVVPYRAWVSTIKRPGFAPVAIPPVSGMRYSPIDPWLVAWEQDASDQSWSLHHNFFWRITRGEMPFIRGCACGCSVARLCLTLFDPRDCSTARLPCPSLPPGVCSDSCPLSWWCHLSISYSAALTPHTPPHHRPVYFCLHSLPASGAFPMIQLFSSGGQSMGASATASGLLVNTQGRFPLGLTGLIFLQSNKLSRVFSGTTVQKHPFFTFNFLCGLSYPYMTTGKTIALTRWTFVGKVMALLFKYTI